MNDVEKGIAGAVVLIAILVGIAVAVVYNTDVGVTVLVQIENENQLQLVEQGQEPAITVVSLTDSAVDQNLKRLEVNVSAQRGDHISQSYESTVTDWLQSLGVAYEIAKW